MNFYHYCQKNKLDWREGTSRFQMENNLNDELKETPEEKKPKKISKSKNPATKSKAKPKVKKDNPEIIKKEEEKVKITPDGKQKILDKIESLKEDLKKLREEKAGAYVLTGDTWHDNPYFNQLEQAEERLLKSIREYDSILENAEIVEPAAINKDVVGMGSIIKCSCIYEDDDEPEEEIYEIVGHGETDLEHGKLSYDSLVAKNLMGLKVNDEAIFDTPGGKVKYTIIAIYEDRESAK